MPWIFLLLPWVELWTLIELGAATSGLVAVAYVFLTMVLGVTLIRRQGLSMIRQMQQQANGTLFGPQMLMDELSVVSCGLLLMIPGLVTDFLALVFLIGPLRRRLLKVFRGGQEPPDPSVYEDSSGNVTLEGDYRRLDD